MVFALDVSTSMGPYLAESRREILARAAELSPADRFNVVAFAGEVACFAENPVTPSEDSLAGLRAWLEALQPASGSDVAAALTRALGMADVSSVVLISDGQASRGVTAPEQLAETVRRENRAGARVDAVSPAPSAASPGGAALQSISGSAAGEVRALTPDELPLQ